MQAQIEEIPEQGRAPTDRHQDAAGKLSFVQISSMAKLARAGLRSLLFESNSNVTSRVHGPQGKIPLGSGAKSRHIDSHRCLCRLVTLPIFADCDGGIAKGGPNHPSALELIGEFWIV